MALITAGPAGAAPTADTTTTFTVTGGALNVTAPGTADLGDGLPGTAITAAMTPVAVADTRAALVATWDTTVTSTDFTTGGGGAGETIADTEVDYWSGPALADPAPTGGGTFLPGQANAGAAVALSTDPIAFSHTAGTGNNSVSWNPTLVVNVPPQAVAGDYTGVVTHSVA